MRTFIKILQPVLFAACLFLIWQYASDFGEHFNFRPSAAVQKGA